MIERREIESLIAAKLAEGNYFIVSLEISASNNIKLVIDNEKGITIDECVEFSRVIEHNLDRGEEDFALEVTSPGLSSPLLVFQQYKKNIGRELAVYLKDETTIRGELKEVNQKGILIEEQKKEKVEGKKKKQILIIDHNIDFQEINKAFIIIKF